MRKYTRFRLLQNSVHIRAAAPAVRPSGVTTRAILIGCLLIPFNALWVLQVERVMYGPYPSQLPICSNVVFVLAALLAVNALLRRAAPRIAFSQGELLTLWTMLTISTGLTGSDGVPILAGLIPHGAWYATSSNNWGRFLGAFPSWLVIRDRSVLRGFYLGNSTLYQPAVLRAWIVPVLGWTLFMVLLLWVANCINVLVRKQWADHERLTFPIVWLPVEMTEGGAGTSFFRNRLMWGGCALAASINLWNGIAFLHPALPTLPIGIIDLKPLITAKPWDAIDWLPTTLYPIAIGLGYLLPLDLLFSCWFFFLLWKLQLVVSRSMAWDATADFPFIREQGFGAVMGLFLYYLWSGRHAYAKIWRQAWAPQRAGAAGSGSFQEALTPRQALLGVAVGLAGLFAFCTAASVAWWVTVAFFAIYLATITVVTRIRAELGSPVHDFHFMGPDAMLPRMVGTAPFKQSDLAFFTFGFSLTRAHRSDTMPAGLEGLQMARMRGLESRRMLYAIMLAVLVGTLSVFWAFAHQGYHLGAAAKMSDAVSMPQQGMERTASWIDGTQDARTNIPACFAMAAGCLVTLGLLLCRLRFFGFPLHPLGFAISSSWAIHLVWVPLLIAWLLKGLTMRYGGLRAYRQFLPFFLGLILGDCIVGSFWGLMSLVLGIRTYNFFGG